MKSTIRGHQAEGAVSQHLKNQGYKILATNWRRPRCEVDIIAQKDEVVYFIEVKYRSQPVQGSGFEYITGRKQAQLRFAAAMWTAENDYGGDIRLMAAEVTGVGYESVDMIEI